MSEPTEQLAPTPRTNAAFEEINVRHSCFHLLAMHEAREVARQLERELAEANEAVRRCDYENSLLVADLSTERAAREAAEQRISELEAECQNHVEHIAPLRHRAETAEVRLERYHDLVRYQRSELHQADLITDDEYVELLSDSKSVARLHAYDDLRKSLKSAEAKLAELQKASLALYDFCLSHISAVQDIPDEVWIPFKEAVNSPRQAIDAAMKS